MMADHPPKSAPHQDITLVGDKNVDPDHGLDGSEWPDNLSISFDSLMAFLDQNSALPPNTESSQVILQGLDQGKLSSGQSFLDDAFQPVPGLPESSAVMNESSGELRSFHCDGSNYKVLDAIKKENDLDFSLAYEDTLTESHNSRPSLHMNNGNIFAHSSNCLGLSRPEVNSLLMDSSGGFFNSSTYGNLDYQQFCTNLASSNASVTKAEEASPYCSQNAHVKHGLYFDSGKSCYNQTKDGSLSQLGIEVPDFNANNESSVYLAKGEGTDSSHFLMPERSGLTDNVHDDIKTIVEPNTFLQEGNFCPSLARDLFMHPHRTFENSFHSDMNATRQIYMGNASNSILTSYRESAANFSGNGLIEFLPLQFSQPSIIQESEEKMQMKDERDDTDERMCLSDNSYSSSEVELGTQSQSTCTLSPDFPSMEFDDVLTIIPTELSNLEDACFRGESSTDSSPLPSRRNSTLGNLDAPKGPDSVLDIKVHRKKEKVLPENESKDKKITSYSRQYENYVITNSSAFQSNPPRSSTNSDDFDVCILDEISAPVLPPNPLVRPHPVSERSGFHEHYPLGLGGMRIRANDERLTFHLALQDLSQPKSEANPPEGVLTVPLLRHQRIALSWMVQKETNSLHCSGGILADDQGLGKTISTIALILTERSPPSMPSTTNDKQGIEAWNLDDDDEDDNEASVHRVTKKPRISGSLVISQSEKRDNSMMVVSSRPAAGSLIVCPTSVLRQWAEELKVKVAEKAKLSFLVYHGSNRTKDPEELAKYDVVLTTYAIVSMEVPKQPLADKDDDEAIKTDISGSMGDIADNKSKNNRKKSKGQNTVETASQESAARPLARVRWFRVVLDEAQSIKNYRTQVARACWGLRAKRRWCLSGTPIQNAVDDLYSYFRFLKFEPYSVYKSFCSTIKIPINRNPVNGYKKLQAVLKTVMLRRTKGTLIDGKPIITLPPKTVTLKKVDFSNDERIFYSSLEAESREQFKVYAALGTVKQNYVNILLMLLRLRQACDHPLLVKGRDSNSSWRSSLEMAKKLPKQKLKDLLSCLEACSALCVICNDPPEDAVVTLCGHVFCNQCICEHLIGEENICPSVGCKVRLNVASVFSKSTLASSIADLPAADSFSTGCGSVADAADVCGTNLSYNSSKIRAALEILRSLPKIECSPRGNSEKLYDEASEKSEVEANGAIQILSNFSSRKCSTNLDDARNLVSHKHLRPVTEKAIVFSQWTRMLDLLEVPLRDSCIEYRRLDGTMSVSARDKAVKDFNTCPEVSVMIMSLKAASLGLNMVSACHVILLDLWWNPTTEDQAIDRAHRIGQTRPVTVSRLTVKDTVEDRILGLQEKKREMVASAFGEDESGSRQTRLTVDDLKYLFMVS